ncbi:MAG: monovalent cation/H(+) antiporter subunit G [Lysobacteraceae bacterium]
MSIIASILVCAGVLLLVVSALGLFTLPDALSRQHAATKSATLALGLLLAGVGIHVNDAAWWGRVVVIIALLLMTLPVAAHMLARAAARHAYRPEELRDAPDPEQR